jgi:hypothetical protein
VLAHKQDPRCAAFPGVSLAVPAEPRSSTSSLITTYYSPKRTFPPPTSTSRKKRSSTKRSIAADVCERARSSNVAT